MSELGILERIDAKLTAIALAVGAPSANLDALAEKLGISDAEAAFVDEVVTPITAPTTEAPVVDDPYAGVDEDGVVWDARIHSKAKEPKSATTGKWKRRKGIKDELYDEVLAELKGGNTAIVEEVASAPTAPTAPSAPSAPSAPVAPVAPTAPTTPSTPATAGTSDQKAEVALLIKSLESTYNVVPMDVTALIQEKTGFDTLDRVTTDVDELIEELNAWRDLLATGTNAITEMTTIAEANQFQANLKEGLDGILGEFDASTLGEVHYTDTTSVVEKLQAYLVSWQEL